MRLTVTPDTWKEILKSAYLLFEDAEERGFGTPPFHLGGGTVLMFHMRHRLSKDIDFFGYDAQWLSVLTPRLNDRAAAMASDYSEQGSSLKIALPLGDIDFIVAADVTRVAERRTEVLEGRPIAIEDPAEILAKKLFYRAAAFTARDVYDMAAAIDLLPSAAAAAVRASRPRLAVLSRRLDELAERSEDDLKRSLIPYDGALPHAERMIVKVADFAARLGGEGAA